MGQTKTPDSLEPMTSSYLVELSLVAPSGQHAIAEGIQIVKNDTQNFHFLIFFFARFKRD